ncbi:unnamed protein product [Citrullus colocynthis]|uniref:Uncharacterized protein n=1 Tax=Citrullus colocynthis TaxID=252529 RepID=A0ABP0Y2H8_9ROSI
MADSNRVAAVGGLRSVGDTRPVDVKMRGRREREKEADVPQLVERLDYTGLHDSWSRRSGAAGFAARGVVDGCSTSAEEKAEGGKGWQRGCRGEGKEGREKEI